MKKQNNSLPEKKREEWHGKIQSFIDIDTIKSEIYKDLINSFITWKAALQDKLSILDLPKLHSLTDNEKFHLLSVFFSSHDQKTDDIYFDRKKNLITQSWINYINQLLNDAVDYYQEYLLRSIWIAFIQKRNKKKSNPSKISFKNTQDVLEFIDATTSEKNSKADRQIDCSLLKIAIWLHEDKQHEKELSDAENKFKEIKEKYFFPYFYDYKWQEINQDLYKKCFELPWDCDYVQLKTKSDISNKLPIFFRSSWRIKDPQKRVLKIISNRKYTSIDSIHDNYGIRNEVNNTKDALYLLEYLRVNIFNKKWDIVDKKIFVTDFKKDEDKQIEESMDFINIHKNDLDPDFYNYLIWYFSDEKAKKEDEKKDPKKEFRSNKDYRDIKIKWKLWWKKVEIQISLVNSKNEMGFSHHYIHDAKRKISAMVRLQSYIPESIIYRYIYEAIEKNIQEDTLIWRKPELLILWWYKWDDKKILHEDKQNAAKKIFEHLLKNQKSFVKLDLAWKQHSSIYTTIDHRNAYHQDNNKKLSPDKFHFEDYKKMYPDWAQIEFDWKWTNNKI